MVAMEIGRIGLTPLITGMVAIATGSETINMATGNKMVTIATDGAVKTQTRAQTLLNRTD